MKRTVGVLLTLMLGLAACGSRVAHADVVAAAGGEGGAGTTTPAGGGGGGGTTAPPGTGTGTPADANSIGTLKNPCSAAKGAGAAVAGTPGVTATSIKIGVISDRKNEITPVPTIGVEEAVQAFVDMCNDSGGINGRKLVLTKYDAGILNTDAVTKQACADGLFALVGDGAVQDQQGIQTRVNCGLPEIAAYSATTDRAESKDFFQGAPTRAQGYNVGPCRYIAKRFPAAVKKAAIVFTNVAASSVRAEVVVEGCESVGFKFIVKAGTAFGEKNFAPIITNMKSKGVKYITVVSVVPDTSAVLREAKKQGLDLDVIDLGQQYYDQAMADEPAADGAFVLTNTAPFAEAKSNPAMQVYQKWMDEVKGPQTSLGVQAFSGSLLFAQAAAAAGNGLTRESLIAQVKKIHTWDAGGLQLPADPGANAQNDCFLYLQIKDKKFVRAFPAKGFSCSPTNAYKLSKPYFAGS